MRLDLKSYMEHLEKNHLRRVTKCVTCRRLIYSEVGMEAHQIMYHCINYDGWEDYC